jgi:pSer/pThr/pTyr-binding forkhead associated (FHA) protein
LNSSEKFCSVCKNKNERGAAVCRYCGAPLSTTGDLTATTRNTEIKINYSEKFEDFSVDEKIIPANGIAVYFAGTTKPVEILNAQEFVIGRRIIETSESFLDLSDFDGFKMGLSRRHAMVRHTETGYEIIDLSSTNGTWLNDERLVPYTPYPLPSGSQLRLSRIRLFIYYRRSSSESKSRQAFNESRPKDQE